MNQRYVIKDHTGNYIYSDSSSGGYPGRTDSLIRTEVFSKASANSYVKVMHEENNWMLYEVIETSEGISIKKVEWDK